MRKSVLILYISSMLIVLVIFTVMLITEPNTKTELLAADSPVELSAASARIDDETDDTILASKDSIIVYEYVYLGDGVVERIEENLPYFLYEKDLSYFKTTFSDWEILVFTEHEIVLRKVIDGNSPQHYVLCIYDGFVAVFTEDDENGTVLKMVTDMPVKTLPIEEQEKLLNGIPIIGNDRLIKALEDFGS